MLPTHQNRPSHGRGQEFVPRGQEAAVFLFTNCTRNVSAFAHPVWPCWEHEPTVSLAVPQTDWKANVPLRPVIKEYLPSMRGTTSEG